jgi:hypothetical protein
MACSMSMTMRTSHYPVLISMILSIVSRLTSHRCLRYCHGIFSYRADDASLKRMGKFWQGRMAMGYQQRQRCSVSKVWMHRFISANFPRFFKYGAQRAKPYVKNSLFTMAMRGSGDTAIPLTTEKAVQALVDAVAAQRQILDEVFADVNLTQHDIPQMWCLYKEVQGYYESGLWQNRCCH